MLQVLGEEQLAKQAFLILKTNQKKRNAWSTNPKDLSPDPLVRFEFVGDWVWPGMNRVDHAISTGNDATALETLRVLARGLDTLGRDAEQQRHADLVRQLLRDWTRRQTDVAPADHNSVAFVIWDLQNVGLVNTRAPAYQWSDDTRFKRAVDYGDQMVERLLDVLEHDRRLTRGQWSSGNFGGDGNGPKRDYPSVSDIALRALQGVLQIDYSDQLWKIVGELQQSAERADSPKTYDEVTSDAKRQLAPIIRADWEKARAVPKAQRPYLVLQDDTAGAQKWLDAARAITASADPKFTSYDLSSLRQRKVPFWGEPLRALQKPSVSELLARRSNELTSVKYQDLRSAVELALILHFWDEAAGRPVLLARMREFRPSSDVGLLLRLLSAAPPEGREIYAKWLRGLKRDADSQDSADAFRPLWRNLDDPFWQQVAKDIFANPASPWNHVLSPLESFHDLDKIIRAPLIVVPEWNAVVRRDLNDQTPLGVAKWSGQNIEFKIEGTPGWHTKLSPEARISPEGEAPFRVCDLVANVLSSRGAPPFSILAPTETRKSNKSRLGWLFKAEIVRSFPDSTGFRCVWPFDRQIRSTPLLNCAPLYVTEPETFLAAAQFRRARSRTGRF